MGWKRKTLIGAAVTIGLGYAGLAYVTREPNRPIVNLPVSGQLLLTGATVVDPVTGTLTPGSSILMDQGRIVRVEKDGATQFGPDIRRMSVAGKFVVPGFNDMHAHAFGPADPSNALALMLANGVTGFRQMSGSDAMLKERREGRLPLTKDSPEPLIMPGALLTPLTAAKPGQTRASVRDAKANGADFIKVVFVSPPMFEVAVDEAKRNHLPIAGHVPAGLSVVSAAKAGMRAIEHLGPANGMLIACSSHSEKLLAQLRKTTEVPAPPEFHSHIVSKLAEWAFARTIINPVAEDHEAGAVGPTNDAMASFDEERCRGAARSLKAAGNWQIPTLIRLKSIYLPDDAAFSNNPDLRYVSASTLTDWRDVTGAFAASYSKSDRAIMRRGFDFNYRLVRILDEEGVQMLAGSDAGGSGWLVPGFALHHEFDELAKAGLTPLRILQMTTSDAARFLGRTATMGQVSPGRNADLVILDGDPTRDVANLHKIAAVVRRGFYYSADDLVTLKQKAIANGGFKS